eukprot:NODE_6366_length_513_cov_0.917031.p1 GENE.NODE_6366_length_513_cov_0.917031~~NODE_6366_length_513_cov_0.917031.p1  ORF type:complete len:137 (+),score=26.76 NODE_6366_length_513_cov_0.917031:62-412(+)
MAVEAKEEDARDLEHPEDQDGQDTGPEEEAVPTEIASEEKEDKDAMAAVFAADCMELYSPGRVNKYVKRYGLEPGSYLDLLTGWDFDRGRDRTAALRLPCWWSGHRCARCAARCRI